MSAPLSQLSGPSEQPGSIYPLSNLLTMKDVSCNGEEEWIGLPLHKSANMILI